MIFRSGSSGGVKREGGEGKKHEIYAAAFGSHQFGPPVPTNPGSTTNINDVSETRID